MLSCICHQTFLPADLKLQFQLLLPRQQTPPSYLCILMVLFFPSHFHIYVQNCLALINQTNRSHFSILQAFLSSPWGEHPHINACETSRGQSWQGPALGLSWAALSAQSLFLGLLEKMLHVTQTLFKSQQITFFISFSPFRGCPTPCYMQAELVGLLLHQ